MNTDERVGTDACLEARMGIWVRWLKPERIGLIALASGFHRTDENEPRGSRFTELSWEHQGSVSFDSDTAYIISRGILGQKLMVQFTGRSDDGMREAFLQRLILSGSEDGRYIPGGISSYMEGDGTFSVQVVKDSEGEVVAVPVVGNGGEGEEQED
ncbi:hypothetical protein BDZ97DRAFT_1915283 [Flammula alnicola]|nr:hypothetical protein BDZ97DRAFT_1915283 [Flammula alnicola]